MVDRETNKKLDDVLVVTAQADTDVFLDGEGEQSASAVVARVRFLLIAGHSLKACASSLR